MRKYGNNSAVTVIQTTEWAVSNLQSSIVYLDKVYFEGSLWKLLGCFIKRFLGIFFKCNE